MPFTRVRIREADGVKRNLLADGALLQVHAMAVAAIPSGYSLPVAIKAGAHEVPLPISCCFGVIV